MTITINGTTGIAGVDGSAATPAVQGADTNTGVFYPAADTVGIATGGTERVRVASAGQIGIGGANYGTSGQVLTSGGAAAAPSWATVSASGQLIRAPQVLTSGTSYTTPAGCTAILVEMWGGGGGGGSGGFANTSDTASPGTGGGGGAYLSQYIPVSPSTTYTVAIGAAGSGGAVPAYPTAGANGTAGGTTSITVGATTYSCTGGGAGSGGKISTTGAQVTQSAAAVGGIATGTSGSVEISGGAAEKYKLVFGAGNSPANGWGGGSSFAGPAGYPGVSNGDAVPTTVTTPGTGGGGGGSSLGSANTPTAGAAGGAGRMIIWEFT